MKFPIVTRRQDHRISFEHLNESIYAFHKRGTCSCGWRGPWRILPEEVSEDLEKHITYGRFMSHEEVLDESGI